MADKRHFSFFESYHEAFKNLPREVVGEVVNAMGEYYFFDNEIPLDGVASGFFELIKPIMDSSKKKAANGRQGGAPEGNTNAMKQAKNKQKTSKIQAKTNDKDKDKDKDKEYLKEKRFTPPTLDDVRAYCRERNNTVDPETFIDFYTSKGWKVGNQPMKDWKAAVRTWERNRGQKTPEKKPDKIHNFAERDYDFDALTREFARN